MDFNFHTHTYRCGHADGKDEEYVLRAIECGIKRMGFSDHAPYLFPDGYEINCHMQMSDVKSYFQSIKNLRDKYADKIEILVGFEMEYLQKHFDGMLENAIKCGAEYLILGQHYVSDGHPDEVGAANPKEPCERLEYYVNCVCRGIKSGVFSYVAHPDMVKFDGDYNFYQSRMEEICRCSLENDIPLELNCLGIRSGRNYPDPKFWEVVGKVGSPVTIGFDSHTPNDAYDGDSVKVAKWLIKRYKLNYIGEPKIIRLN